MTEWKALCEELADALACHYPGHVDDDELIKRARAALAEPEPEVGELTDEELLRMAVTTGLLQPDGTTGYREDADVSDPVLNFAHAAIAADRARYGRPAPAPAGEVAELVAALRIESSRCTCTLLTTDDLRRAAELLEQCYPTPVPVADRLPELRGMFERILCVARSSGEKPVGNIELADRLIKAVVSWGASGAALPTLPVGEPAPPVEGEVEQ